jgi:hypothetical protein
MCAYVLVALLHCSHGATVDLESKGAGVTRGVVKAWVHSLLTGCSVLLLQRAGALWTPEGSASAHRLPSLGS